jgi:hypothetical protein
LAGFDIAGETAASPVVVVEPVLAFCASAIEFAKWMAAATAMTASFMLVPSGADMKTTLCAVSSLICSRAVSKHLLNAGFRACSSHLY